MGGEVWVVQGEVWEKAGQLVYDRFLECLRNAGVVAVDIEGGLATFQLSFIGSLGLVSFLFCQSYWNVDLTRLWLEYHPLVIHW